MDHTLMELGLRLSYLRGERLIGTIDRQRLFNDLLNGTPVTEALAWLVRPSLSEYDHVVLARDLHDGTIQGMLAAHNHHAYAGPFLWLETGFVAQGARGQNLLRRMIALMLLRIVGCDSVPVAVASLTYSPVALHVMQRMASQLDGARFAPMPEGPVVDLASVMLTRDVAAALGQRFAYARTDRSIKAGLAAMQGRVGQSVGHAASVIPAVSPVLALLDMRRSSEGRLIADLRAIYRESASEVVKRPRSRPVPRPIQDGARVSSLEGIAAS